MRFSISFAWRDTSGTGQALWVFCICLALGVMLVAATGGLYRQVSQGLGAESRALAGGDVEVSASAPLPPETLRWIRETGAVSLLIELDTMLETQGGKLQLVELQSVDERYPLYGELALSPVQSVRAATERRAGTWGIALDPVLAEWLDLARGDRVRVGALALEVRALIDHQPDRSFSADWRGPPVLIAAEALEASGLVVPGSRIEYEYRVRTAVDPGLWRSRFYDAFPSSDWEVSTFTERGNRVSERIDQVASALLIIGFSTLFIGGLGVSNSVQSYLQGKLATIATLRALGLRDGRLAAVYLLQIGGLAAVSCGAGGVAGFLASLAGAGFAEGQLRVATAAASALTPSVLAVGFGIATAFLFALPPLGRALAVDPAVLFRQTRGGEDRLPLKWRVATAGMGIVVMALVLLALPDPLFAAGFVAVLSVLLLLLDAIVRGVRRLAAFLEGHRWLEGRLPLRLAVGAVQRRGSSLRTALLSVGSSLTLLVVCATLVGALVETIEETIPAQSPSIVLYDIFPDQRDDVLAAFDSVGAARVELAPLVRAKLAAVNGEALLESGDPGRQRAAREEHKLSYRSRSLDDVTVLEQDAGSANGATAGRHLWMEDREARQLDLEVGDLLSFDVEGMPLDVRLRGIYQQKGLQTRFWFEGLLSEGALEPFVDRYVGAAFMAHGAAADAQLAVAEVAPNVVTVRTATMIETARRLLNQAVLALVLVGSVALGVSLMVLTAAVATSRARQVHEATILLTVGARLSAIRRSLVLEYAVLAVITSVFALVLGTAISLPLLVYLFDLPPKLSLWPGLITACGVSATCLHFGTRYLLKRLDLQPARLLRDAS